MNADIKSVFFSDPRGSVFISVLLNIKQGGTTRLLVPAHMCYYVCRDGKFYFIAIPIYECILMIRIILISILLAKKYEIKR